MCTYGGQAGHSHKFAQQVIKCPWKRAQRHTCSFILHQLLSNKFVKLAYLGELQQRSCCSEWGKEKRLKIQKIRHQFDLRLSNFLGWNPTRSLRALPTQKCCHSQELRLSRDGFFFLENSSSMKFPTYFTCTTLCMDILPTIPSKLPVHILHSAALQKQVAICSTGYLVKRFNCNCEIT